MNRPSSLRLQKWQVAPSLPVSLQQNLSHIHPVLLQILYNRGLTDAATIQAFLDGRYLEKTDPFLLTDMQTAVERIHRAIQQAETITIYGDFDADGITATVLLTQALRGFGLPPQQVRPYIPDRVDEGYGLNIDALNKIKESGSSLVISVDCGIRSVAEAQHARAIGLDLIITDHHSLGPELPTAVAVVNPKRPDTPYPDNMLAGVGIAYKLAQALHQAIPNPTPFDQESLLDLVAIGTVADLVPLLRENRKLVLAGLPVLNNGRRPGIVALAEVARLKMGSLTAESIAFGIAPRINAAGRLTHAYDAARLLAATNPIDARRYAAALNKLNQQRQQYTSDLSDMAESLITPGDDILIAAHPTFLSGIVGLVASRLAEKHYRPAIVIEQGETESRGSCRSIDQFHMTDALDQVAHLLVRHGGHAQAAGFTIENKQLPHFIDQMKQIATERLAGQELFPALSIDAEIDLTAIDWALFDHLSSLEPTGTANAAPTFVSRDVSVLHHRLVGQDRQHLQLQLSCAQAGGHYTTLSGIAFRQGAWAAQLPEQIDIVYTISVNEWNGRRDLQLMIQDIQPAAAR